MRYRRLVPSLLAACLAQPFVAAEEATPAGGDAAFMMNLPDITQTRERLAASIYGTLWNLPELAEMRAEFQTSMTDMQQRDGTSPLALWQALGWAHVSIYGMMEVGDPTMGVERVPVVAGAVDLGSEMAAVWAEMEQNLQPATTPKGAAGALQPDGPGAPRMVRFDQVLSFANGAQSSPRAARLSESGADIEMMVRGPELLQAWQPWADELPEVGGAEVLAAMATLDHISIRSQVLADGMSDHLTWRFTDSGDAAAMPALLSPVDHAVLDQIPDTAMLVVAMGLDGSSAQAIVDQMQAEMPMVGEVMAELPIPLATLAEGLTGTMTIALLPAEPFPSVMLQLPMSDALAATVDQLLADSGAPITVPAIGASMVLPVPLPPPFQVMVARNESHLLITSAGPDMAAAWLGGQGGGFAASALGGPILQAAGDQAVLIGASDTPRMATMARGLMTMFGADMPAEAQTILDAVLATIATNGGPGHLYLVNDATGGVLDTKGLAGGFGIMPMIAAIAIPNLMESRVSANESFAATTLKAAIFPAQVQAQAGSWRDDDQDNIGEHLFLPELSGTIGVGTMAPGQLSLLSPDFDQHRALVNGYEFKVFLPNGPGQASDGSTPLDPAGVNLRERYWVAYAAPVVWGDSGRRVFAFDQSGIVYSRRVEPLSLDDFAWNSLYDGGDWGDPAAGGWQPYVR